MAKQTVKQMMFDSRGEVYVHDTHLTEREYNEKGSEQQGDLLVLSTPNQPGERAMPLIL